MIFNGLCARLASMSLYVISTAATWYDSPARSRHKIPRFDAKE